MMRKQNSKKITLPGLMWDNESWVPFTKYPNHICFTDKVLANVLGVTGALVGQWKQKKMIPFQMTDGGVFCSFNVNAVIEALKVCGYKQDPNKKSRDNES